MRDSLDPGRKRGLGEDAGNPVAASAGTSLGRYEDFIRATADWVWEVDQNLNYTFVSRGVAKVFGVPPQDLLGSYLFSLSSFRTVERALMSTVEAIEDRVPFRNKALALDDARGVRRAILLSGVPVFDPASGRFAGYRGSGADVTERSRTEAAPGDAPENFGRALDDFTDLVSAWRWEAGPDLRLTQLSEGYGEHAGLSPEESLGRAFPELWRLPAAARDLIGAKRLFRDQNTAWSHAALGEERSFVIAGRPVLDAEGRFAGYRGLGADVTAQLRAAEGGLSRAQQSVNRANQAKSEFLANISHELRTPLNAIIGFADAMRGQALGAMRNKRYLQYSEDIHDSAQHLLDIVNEILDLSQIEADSLQLEEKAVDLPDLVESCRRMLHEVVDKAGLSLELELAADLPQVRADPVKLKQILLNLLSNAIKFTPSGGSVGVRAEINGAGNLAIEVRDTGIGIRSDDIPRVLTRYGRIEGAAQGKGGAGLGLSITQGLIELHGGSLRLLSGEEAGTRALVELPRERLLLDDAEGEPWKVLF